MKTLSIGIVFALLLLSGCAKNGPMIVPLTSAPPSSGGPAQNSGYTEVGNGGDFVRILFEQGRQYAEGVVGRVDEKSVPLYLKQALDAGELEWLLKNKASVANHIRAARHVWVDKLPAACTDTGCGCNLGGGEVYLAQAKCESTIGNSPEASQLLVHESLHAFFGTDELKVRRVGAAFFSIWSNMGHPDYPHWKEIPTPPIPLKLSKGVWTGREFLVWNGAGNMAAYDPATTSWRVEETHNSPGDFKRDPHWMENLHYGHAVWNTGLLSVFYCESFPSKEFSDRNKPEGLVYDPARKTWKRMSSDGRPKGCTGSDPFSIGDSLFQLSSVHESLKDLMQEAAIYSPGSDTWVRVPVTEKLVYHASFSTLWTGSQVIFWGGHEWRGRADVTNLGYAYDPSTGTWTDLPTDGAPSPRGSHQAVWTGSKMFLYGGQPSRYDPSEEHNLVTGAFYEPATGKWTAARPGTLKSLDWGSDLRSVWTGTQVLISNGNKLATYRPDKDEWSSVDLLFPREIDARHSDFVWTGMEVLIWDGRANRGYALFPN